MTKLSNLTKSSVFFIFFIMLTIGCSNISTEENIVEQEEKKPLPTEIIANGNMIYAAQEYAVPADEVAEMLKYSYPKNPNKQVFLTFDDGPCKYTKTILGILKDKEVHATFFVLGSQLRYESSKSIIKQTIEEGHSIANHSFSHSYKKLYPGRRVNVKTFMDEIDTTNKMIKNIVGTTFDTRVLRLPGGYGTRIYFRDVNLPLLDSALRKENIVSLDWSAETKDAVGRRYSTKQLVKNAISQSEGQNQVILLMHDVKERTVLSLPDIIDHYKSNGYEFKVISNPSLEKNNNKQTKKVVQSQ
ncbi:MAG: polysaccharide deacetylase family protein [Saprospiraceae bacterium]